MHNYTLISPTDVTRNIYNLQQITFEVTDSCNLKCKYCGYGEFYEGFDERESKNISLRKSVRLIQYLMNEWSMGANISYKKRTYVSFYGGEPLLNIEFIKQIVEIFKKANIPQREFVFTMTTNGILLTKYMDYLVENDFKLLISLDGNKESNSYRVNLNNQNSFDTIYSNVNKLKNKFPSFFEKSVNFNAVLHNRNDYAQLVNFFQKHFNKIPSVAELNSMGIRKDRLDEFSKMYNSKIESLEKDASGNIIKQKIFMDNPQTSELCTFLHWHSGNVFKSYNDLFVDNSQKKWVPTGTCLPFGKKMFVTVNGKILACERISHDYILGYVDEKEVRIDPTEIAEKYNNWYKKYISQCQQCYNNHTCKHCMFYNADLNKKAVCPQFMNKEKFEMYKRRQYSLLMENPDLYRKIMKEVVIH